jgi:acyl-CoA thioester hydrolase
LNRGYFRPDPEGPPPLRVEVSREVRFEEVDPLAIVWHGRYPSFFEDARVALCDRYGIGYMTCHENGFVTPIRKLHVDYQRPLRFREPFTIEAIVHWTEAARIDMEFVLRNAAREVTTTGYTVQMMLDAAGTILLVPPPYYRAFLDRWKAGELA